MSPDRGIGRPGTIRKTIAQHIYGIDGPVCSCKLGENVSPGSCSANNIMEQHDRSIGSMFSALNNVAKVIEDHTCRAPLLCARGIFSTLLQHTASLVYSITKSTLSRKARVRYKTR